jgi:aminopeptidase N
LKNTRILLAVATIVCVAFGWWMFQRRHSRILPVTTPTPGISQTLAEQRARDISSLRYDLTLTIPEKRQESVTGREAIRFRLARVGPVLLDFAQPQDRVSSVLVNGVAITVRSEHGHLAIPANALARGENTIEIAFTAGNEALNRNDDYLYSLFVPARASQAFPCFDQPDLKGSLSLTLELPSSWVAIANGAEIGRERSGDRSTIRFAPTQPLPTYLFGFAAGAFAVERAERDGRAFHMYHRETDAGKVAANRDAIFDLHHQALEWLEDYTQGTYPFEKFDFVLLPAFQFAGMEHPGAIYYNAPALLLDKTATQEQFLSRANTIAHETAHMWFGNLVTMKWFNDVWLKEVFANFMAAKIVNPSFPAIDHELRFLLQHYPAAYDVDRTSAANPIRQSLENLNDAGSLYGAIIYDKAPIVMRQLEQIVGADGLRDGLRDYLARYAFGNATWNDLITILDTKTEDDLAGWSRIWVEEPGRPTITTSLKPDAGTIGALSFTQSDPQGRSRIWNQRLQVALGYEQGARISPLRMNASSVELTSARNLPLPRYILPNSEGAGYGLFKLDTATKAFFLEKVPEIGDALTRATAWITLWDDMLEGGAPPRELLALALRALPAERDEQNVQHILTVLGRTFWTYLSETERQAAAPALEKALRAGIRESAGTSQKSAYFAAFRRVVTTPDGVTYLERVWRRSEAIPGLPFSETDDIAMAQDLAIRNAAAAPRILAEQTARIANPDRKARFQFVAPALSPDEAVRDAFFASLADPANREREPWAIDALAFLNHPLRRRHAERYVDPSLSLLRDIQRTGDIFFPVRWTRAALDGHNSPAVAQTVRAFLERQEDYPPRLRQIIEQSSDQLMRASSIIQTN